MKRNCIFVVFLFLAFVSSAQRLARRPGFCITGYYAGPANRLDSFPIEKLTHIIFSFGHLKGNRLNIDNAGDTATIRKMVSYKKNYPQLKVILSLGGWTGCKTCPAVFSTNRGRKEFAASVKELSEYFHTDGIDLDWEYPGIQGPPDHPFSKAGKHHFTLLIKALRKKLGPEQEISFAAGGFDQFIDSSIEWKKVMPLVNKVYVMTYDLVHGYSTTSGHHTPLYSTREQKPSADNAIKRMLAAGVPSRKIVIGGAFYARMFAVDDTLNRGLYRPGRFYRGISYSDIYDSIAPARGFTQYWDPVAQAPYAFNPERKILVTWDDSVSIRHKTEYARENNLGGIMFWQLADDRLQEGLLDVIHRTKLLLRRDP
jgi:chitinase